MQHTVKFVIIFEANWYHHHYFIYSKYICFVESDILYHSTRYLFFHLIILRVKLICQRYKFIDIWNSITMIPFYNCIIDTLLKIYYLPRINLNNIRFILSTSLSSSHKVSFWVLEIASLQKKIYTWCCWSNSIRTFFPFCRWFIRKRDLCLLCLLLLQRGTKK